MAKKSALAPMSAPAQAPAVPLDLAGSANAPMIYFEDAPTFGHSNGVIRVTLAAARIYPDQADPSKAGVDRVIVAHLRMSLVSARALRRALDRAILLGTPSDSEAKN